ncbi:hypothetical protein BH10ACT11_BH10ACT11_17050 [soil metagenome]
MSPLLAAFAVLLAFAGAREVAGSAIGARLGRRLQRGLPGAESIGGLAGIAARLGVEGRLERAALEGRVTVRGFVLFKFAGALAGLLAGVIVAPAAPGRLQPILLLGTSLAGFLGPDALAERIGRRRRAEGVAALPDALDLLAVGASGGRSPAAVLSEVALTGPEPLASELAVGLAAVDCGASLDSALSAMRRRIPGPELGSLAAALDRSRRHGSPLAEQLHAQAASLRLDARRRVAEREGGGDPKS